MRRRVRGARGKAVVDNNLKYIVYEEASFLLPVDRRSDGTEYGSQGAVQIFTGCGDGFL
jgi:hypothetical protein